MWNLIERMVFRYEFARHLRRHIEGLTWRKALSYQCDPSAGDPIEAAGAALARMRYRYPTPSAPKTAAPAESALAVVVSGIVAAKFIWGSALAALS